MSIDIPRYVDELMVRMRECGEEAYIVGGSLRDALLGKEANDYDLATSASPARMLEIFSDHRVIETGLKHGTLTVVSDGKPVEITTFRIDGGYSDARHPDSVSFTRSIEEDLARRDFTVNAMAYNKERGLVDLFGGRQDLDAKIIRAVGDAERRFTEDALRIMRAFRFSAQLGFEIENSTLAAASACRDGLGRVARERIATEFFKLVTSPHLEKPLMLMRERGILEFVLGECIPDGQLISLVQKMPCDEAARLGFLLCRQEKTAAQRALSGLKCSNRQRSIAVAVAQNSKRSIATPSDCARLRAELGESAEFAVSASILLGYADQRAPEWLKSNRAPASLSELAIGGRDLCELGLSGKEIGRVLAELLEATIEKPELNTRESLTVLAKEKINQKKGE